MKKFLFLALGALCGSTLAAKEPPRLLMPDEIISVQGIETNVYFANVFKTVNPDNYFFQVSCPKGKLMKKFWTVTPEKKDIGTYSWKLTVFDDNGKVAEKTVKLKILPQKKIPENLSILMIGDSWTDQSYYVHRLKKLAPALKMIGSNGGLGKDPAKTGIAHEGYGGWTWGRFALERKPVPPGTMPYRTNKFLVEKNGRWSHDFDAYFAKYSNGKKPDFVTIGLGPNDIYALTDENIDNALIRIGKSMDKLIGEIRKSVPDAFIGITLFTVTAGQDAWGKAYGCRSNSYNLRKTSGNSTNSTWTRFLKCQRQIRKYPLSRCHTPLIRKTVIPLHSKLPISTVRKKFPGRVMRCIPLPKGTLRREMSIIAGC